MSRQQNLAVIVGLCGVFGIAAWAFYLRAFAATPAEDWMVYYTTIRAFIDGQLALIYDGDGLTALLNARFATWLSHPLPLHPWLYPPHYLLLLLPFGFLPFAPAGAIFLLLGFIALLAAAFAFVPRGMPRRLCTFSLLLCPATAITVCLGQNTFLTCALLLGGFAALPRRPLLAGLLFGLLTYKPQLWLMVPVALLAGRHWRALAATALTALLLALLSAMVFGLDTWREWIAVMTKPSALYEQWNVIARLNGQSIYTNAVLLGAPVPLANILQGLSSLVAAATVWWCYSRPITADMRIAVLLAATMLAAPHVIDYDSLLLGIAATLLALRASADGFRRGEAVLIVLLWVSPLVNPPSIFPIGFATPLVILLFTAAVMGRGRSQPLPRSGHAALGFPPP